MPIADDASTDGGREGRRSQGRRIVAIGGSAGAIEALRSIVSRLPDDLPIPLLIAIHVPPTAHSALPEILTRSAPFPAAHAVDGEEVRPGRMYVAPPDHHLTVEDDVVRLSRGPRANRHRPSVDVLFDSVARTFGPGGLGVVLSGGLRDGAAGLAAIMSAGGLGIVQDPSEALVSSMPHEALARTDATVLPARRIAAAVDRFSRGGAPRRERSARGQGDAAPTWGRQALVAADGTPLSQAQPGVSPLELRTPDGAEAPDVDRGATVFSCPDCGGVLSEHVAGDRITFRCRVGHSFGPEALAEAEAAGIEEALWAAVRALEEHADLSLRLAARAEASSLHAASGAYRAHGRASLRRANVLRRLVTAGPDENGEGDHPRSRP